MAEEHSGSILLRIKPLLESDGPFLESAEPLDASTPGGEAEDEEPLAALDLRDRVVIALLREGAVSVEEVEAAGHEREHANDEAPDALWRAVASQPSVDAETVFATAARVYAFDSAADVLYRARALLRKHRGRFSLRQRRRLAALTVLPVMIEKTAGRPRWIFATHDPARNAVQRLLASLDVPAYELRYAPAAAIRERLSEVFSGEVALNTLLAETDEAENEAPGRSADASGGDAPSKRPRRRRAGRKRALRGNETVRMFASIYEELLAGAARSGATRVRLATALPEAGSARTEEAGDGARLAAAFDYDDRGEHRRVTLDVPPGAVLSFMRRRTRSARHGTASKAEGKRVHRWVEDRRRTFQIEALPDRTSWAAGRAEIVIEVID